MPGKQVLFKTNAITILGGAPGSGELSVQIAKPSPLSGICHGHSSPDFDSVTEQFNAAGKVLEEGVRYQYNGLILLYRKSRSPEKRAGKRGVGVVNKSS